MSTMVTGNIFLSSAQTLVNPVNCVGVMGKGLAREFRRRFPDMYDDYAKRCAGATVRLGEPYLFRRPQLPWVINFPTKHHWRSRSRLPDLIAGLDFLGTHYQEWELRSLAVPALGCGEGHLTWEEVRPILCQYLTHLEIPIEVFAPR